jgi:hypothetical protein
MAYPDKTGPFSRGNQNPEGCGLGLHLSREIMRAHGGETSLMPSQRGAKFRLSFPAPQGGKLRPRRLINHLSATRLAKLERLHPDLPTLALPVRDGFVAYTVCWTAGIEGRGFWWVRIATLSGAGAGVDIGGGSPISRSAGKPLL